MPKDCLKLETLEDESGPGREYLTKEIFSLSKFGRWKIVKQSYCMYWSKSVFYTQSTTAVISERVWSTGINKTNKNRVLHPMCLFLTTCSHLNRPSINLSTCSNHNRSSINLFNLPQTFHQPSTCSNHNISSITLSTCSKQHTPSINCQLVQPTIDLPSTCQLVQPITGLPSTCQGLFTPA